MLYTRRDFGKLALTVPAAGMVAASGVQQAPQTQRRGAARFDGLNVGVIAPYSFRVMERTDADTLLTYVLKLGLNAVEMQSTKPSCGRSGRANTVGRAGK